MQRLKAIITKIFKLGYCSKLSVSKNQAIILSNQLYMVFLIIISPYLIILPLINLPLLSVGVAIIVLLIISSFLLNKLQNYVLSKWLFIFNILIGAFCFSAIFEGAANIQLIYFVVIISGISIFQTKTEQFIAVCLSLICYYLLELTNYLFFFHAQLSHTHMIIMRYSVTAFIFISLILVIIYLHKNSVPYQKRRINLASKITLSPRETQVLNIILKGKNAKEISTILFIEEGTVRNHIKNIYQKLDVKSKEQLFALFL